MFSPLNQFLTVKYGRDIAVQRSLPDEDVLLILFDVEHTAEAGKFENFHNRLSEIADNHIALAVHRLCRTEQDAQSRAGDLF